VSSPTSPTNSVSISLSSSLSSSSDFLAAKLYYKMLSYKFQENEVDDEFESPFKNAEKNKITSLKYNNED
jgi:agmatinase